MTGAARPGQTYFDVLRSMTDDPDILAAADAAEAEMAAAAAASSSGRMYP